MKNLIYLALVLSIGSSVCAAKEIANKGPRPPKWIKITHPGPAKVVVFK